jgi:hypothetical protein
MSDTKRWISGSIDINIVLCFLFGVVFIAAMLVFAVLFPNPDPFPLKVFNVVLSLAAAGIGAALPGYFELKYKKLLRAGGALALFVIVFNSGNVIAPSVVRLVQPDTPPEPVAASFLSTIDSGDIVSAWQKMDPGVRDLLGNNVADFNQIYSSYRAPLGSTVRRTFVGLNAANSPPGYPVGLYRMFQYITKFSNTSQCRAESLILRATNNLEWSVASYYLGPMEIACV